MSLVIALLIATIIMAIVGLGTFWILQSWLFPKIINSIYENNMDPDVDEETDEPLFV